METSKQTGGLLDRGYGKPAQDKTLLGGAGPYDLDKLNAEQTGQLVQLLRIAAPDNIVGETD